MADRRTSRRRFLGLSSAAAVAGFAGCTDRVELETSSSGGNGTRNESTGDDETDVSALLDGVPELETEYDSRERYGQPGEALDAVEEFDDWEIVQGAGDADEDVAFDGSQSLRLTVDEDETGVASLELDDVDLTDRDLSFAIRTSTPQNLTVNVHVVDIFGNETISSLREITYRAPDVGWFRASPGVYERSEMDTAMDELDRIEFHVLHTMDEAEVWIDDVRIHDTPDQGYVMLVWDDGFRDYYETASPLHDEFGFQTVQAPVPRWTEEGRDGIMTVAELQERQDAGDQIVVHGTHEPIHEYDDEDEIETRIRGDKYWFVENGFEGANYIVYPHNSYDETSLEYFTDYHYCGGFNQAGDVNTTSVYGFDPLALPRTIGHDLDISKRCVDLAEEHHQCTILNFHAFDAENTMPESDYETLLEHIDDADVEVITFDDLWELRTDPF
ncbi:polysaccharide deacetylase family protein [Natrarchaeobius chitinivorans]|uniref:Polysaccharide deacetylase n=1 Tax=Natrarchaeobius chitinivorans TaxID=1679083 RepID=A0A3N6P963_NATCH|nr:polysaccharide deacetylase family protein [Natrarchaeobius chitinivorans]RQG95379.1 polysaccharide deacetylase [Natrarchaeobius chitinivorans]